MLYMKATKLQWNMTFSSGRLYHSSFQIKTLLMNKNHAYGRQRISRPMRIVGPIQFWKGCVINLKKRKKFNPEWLLVFKALQIGPQMHQSMSRAPPTCGPSTGAIWNNSLFLRLYESVDEYTSPLVKHLPRVDNPCMQSRTTPYV